MQAIRLLLYERGCIGDKKSWAYFGLEKLLN